MFYPQFALVFPWTFGQPTDFILRDVIALLLTRVAIITEVHFSPAVPRCYGTAVLTLVFA